MLFPLPDSVPYPFFVIVNSRQEVEVWNLYGLPLFLVNPSFKRLLQHYFRQLFFSQHAVTLLSPRPELFCRNIVFGQLFLD